MQKLEIHYLNPSADLSETSLREAVCQHFTVQDILQSVTLVMSYSEFTKLPDAFLTKFSQKLNFVAIPDEMVINPHWWCVWVNGKVVISRAP